MMLSPEQIEQYRVDGYVSPLEAMSSAEAADCMAQLQRLIAARGWPLDAVSNHKPHLHQKWVSDLVHHPAIVSAVSDVLGPDVLGWRSAFFIKAPRDSSYVAWHQDSIYWGFDSPDVLTAWIALTDSDRGNGCVQVVPGTHLGSEVAHRRSFSRSNLLLRGQVAEVEVPPEQCRDLELRAGQFSLHHVKLLHTSAANPSDRWRAGVAIRYIAGNARRRGPRDSVVVVRGVDRTGAYDHEPRATMDDDPATLAFHRRSVRKYGRQVVREILLRPNFENVVSLMRMALKPVNYAKVLRYIASRADD